MTQKQKFVIAGLFFAIFMLCSGLIGPKAMIRAGAAYSCLFGIILIIDGFINKDD